MNRVLFWAVCGIAAGFSQMASVGTADVPGPSPAKPNKKPTPVSRPPLRSVGHSLSSNEMLLDWLGDAGVLKAKHLQKLTDLAMEHPESKSLVAQAMSRFGVNTTEQFLALFEVGAIGAANGAGIGKVVGEFNPGEWNSFTHSVDPKEYFGAPSPLPDFNSDWVKEQLGSGHSYYHYVELRSSMQVLHVFTDPKIRLPSRSSLANAYETFMHELAHFVLFAPQFEPDASRFDDEAAFERALLNSPGEEVEARTFGIRALTQLVGELPYASSLPVTLETWFSPEGRLTQSPDSLIDLLQGFMGYHSPGVYANRLDLLKQADSEEIAGLSQAMQADPTSLQVEGGSAWQTKAAERIRFLEARAKRIDLIHP